MAIGQHAHLILELWRYADISLLIWRFTSASTSQGVSLS